MVIAASPQAVGDLPTCWTRSPTLEHDWMPASDKRPAALSGLGGGDYLVVKARTSASKGRQLYNSGQFSTPWQNIVLPVLLLLRQGVPRQRHPAAWPFASVVRRMLTGSFA